MSAADVQYCGNYKAMKKYIVLSVNENPAYLYHIPLVCWAWRKLGWQPVVFTIGQSRCDSLIFELLNDNHTIATCGLMPQDGFKSETVAQVSRLYGACLFDGYLMTGDIDMLPLSDYWKPDVRKITSWGRDLTDYHYPICYIGMSSESWRDIMNLPNERYNSLIARDLRKQANMWGLDQDLITERLNASGRTITRIDRGTDKRTGYPIGRVDRSGWRLDHKQHIDAHLFHDAHRNDASFNKIVELLRVVWPAEDFTWYFDYHKEFKKLLQ